MFIISNATFINILKQIKTQNKMKKFKEIFRMHFSAIIGVLLILLIVLLVKLLPREFALQYVEEGELVTETFKSPKDFNERAFELKAKGIKYYLYHD